MVSPATALPIANTDAEIHRFNGKFTWTCKKCRRIQQCRLMDVSSKVRCGNPDCRAWSWVLADTRPVQSVAVGADGAPVYGAVGRASARQADTQDRNSNDAQLQAHDISHTGGA